jgi:ATP-dependent DNA helicase RecG
VTRRFLIDNLEGRYDVTNLGAILLAKNVGWFPSIAGKTIRVVKYAGVDKSRSEFEQVGTRGYAAGFTGLMGFLSQRLPKEERIVSGVRRPHPLYPELAIRETLANALIHQDLTAGGEGPLVEIYNDRIEISNPGRSLVSVDRMLDERRSRNEKLAGAMREFGLCEERGSGLDRTIIEIESNYLPAPEFISSESSMRVILFGPRPFSAMAKRDKLRAAFQHCVLRWLRRDFMSNSSLRARFSLSDDEYQSMSALIAELVKSSKIAAADPNQGKRNARYVPNWAATK